MGSILIVAEIQDGAIREASYELVTMARGIAEASGREVKSLVIGSGVGDLASEFASKGGGETLVVDDASAANYSVDVWTAAIRAAIDASGADLVMISNTPSGWDVAPRIAAALASVTSGTVPLAGLFKAGLGTYLPVICRTQTSTCTETEEGR